MNRPANTALIVMLSALVACVVVFAVGASARDAEFGSLALNKDGYVTCGDIFSVSEGTMEFWFKPATKENNEWVLSIRKDNNNLMEFGFGLSLLQYYVKSSGVGEVLGADKADIALDTWHHVALTFQPKQATLFLDGIPVATKGTNDTFGLTQMKGGEFAIGRGSSENERYNGLVAEIRLSDTIRYEGDFTPSAAAFAPDEHTVALWHFAEGQGEVVKDSSGKNRHGKIVGEVARSKEVPAEGRTAAKKSGPALFPCARIKVAPVIDGKLDDPCWSAAAAAVGFLDLADVSGATLAPRQTTVRLVYDGNALHVAAACLEPAMGQLVATTTARDGPVWEDDCLEFFLAFSKGATEYVHYVFNARGAYYDALTHDAAWNSNLIVAVQRLGDRWVLEAAIPFKELKAKPPAEGDVWAFNLAREHQTGGAVALSSWAHLTEPAFHRPQEFVGLRFAGERLDPASREFSNRRPTLENPSFSKMTRDGNPLHWVLGPGTTLRETEYLSNILQLTTATDHLMARQNVGWRQAAGGDYDLVVMACGDGGAALGVTITYEIAGGKTETMRAIWDDPVAGTVKTHSKKVAIPVEAERVVSIELYRSNRAGTLSVREVQFLEAGAFRGVKEAKRQFDRDRWPIGEPFISPVGFRWATPLSGGPLSILLILPDRASRLAVGLGRRFEMEYDLAWVEYYAGQIYSWGAADRINSRLSGLAKPYDAIVLTVPLKSQAFRNVIRESVNRGTGLVLVYDVNDKSAASGLDGMLPAAKPVEKEEPDILRGVPWRLLPPTKGGQQALASVGTGAFGKGRVVTLGYSVQVQGLMPYGYPLNLAASGVDDWLEYVYSLVARSLLQCANRTMPARIESAAIDAREGTLRVTVAASQAFQGALTMRWTDKYHIADSPETKNDLKVAAGGRAVVTYPMPHAVRRSNGNHLANILLRDDQGKAVDWTVAVLPVESAIRIGETHPFARDWYQAGQPIVGTVAIESRAPAETKASATLELVDASGRCVWRESRAIALAAGQRLELVVAPQLHRVLTVYHRLRATVCDQRGVLDRREWELRLPDQWKYDPSEFRFGAETSYNYHLHTDKEFADYFRSVGVTFSYDGGVYEEMPRSEMPWVWGHMGGGDLLYYRGGSPNRQYCFNNPDVLQKIAEAAAVGYPYAKRSGAVFSSVGDEMELARDGRVEVCFCPFCADGFRRWAQRFYGGLDRLNAEWGTAYQTWDAVKPITAEEARKRGNFAQWVDFRSFMEDSFTQVCTAVKERVKREYPDALIGLTNPFANNPFSGSDNVKLARVEEAMTKYMRQDILKECISLNPAAPSFTHFGYGGRPEWCKWYPWWFAMNRAQFLTWYYPVGDPNMGFMDSLGRQTQRSLVVFETVRDLVSGVGKIFRTFPPARNPVAMLYSQPSMHVAWAESGMRVGDTPWGDRAMYQWAETPPLHGFKLHHRSQENFKALLKETSLQPDFLPPDRITSGKLNDYRMLVLPYCGALSEEVLARIDSFVKAGGTVLADLRAGAYTEHGKPLATRPSFETLFGVKRKTPGFEPPLTSLSCSGAFASVPAGKDFDQSAGREPLVLTSGQAMAKHPDGSPAVIVNARGKGRAVYLNFVPGNGPASTALMARILDLAGVKRDVRLSKGEAPVIGYECFMFERDPVKFLGVLRDMQPQPAGELTSWNGHQFRHAGPEKEKITIHLPGEYHVYDVRKGVYLGRSKAIQGEFEPAEAKVFGLLPYKVTDVTVTGLKPQYRPGEKVQYAAVVAVSNGAAGDHVLRVEVNDPDKRLGACYSRNVLAMKGRYDGSLPLALNDRPGAWTLKIWDVTSKASRTVGFGVSR